MSRETIANPERLQRTLVATPREREGRSVDPHGEFRREWNRASRKPDGTTRTRRQADNPFGAISYRADPPEKQSDPRWESWDSGERLAEDGDGFAVDLLRAQVFARVAQGGVTEGPGLDYLDDVLEQSLRYGDRGNAEQAAIYAPGFLPPPVPVEVCQECGRPRCPEGCRATVCHWYDDEVSGESITRHVGCPRPGSEACLWYAKSVRRQRKALHLCSECAAPLDPARRRKTCPDCWTVRRTREALDAETRALRDKAAGGQLAAMGRDPGRAAGVPVHVLDGLRISPEDLAGAIYPEGTPRNRNRTGGDRVNAPGDWGHHESESPARRSSRGKSLGRVQREAFDRGLSPWDTMRAEIEARGGSQWAEQRL